jgi:hypothetical protein
VRGAVSGLGGKTLRILATLDQLLEVHLSLISGHHNLHRNSAPTAATAKAMTNIVALIGTPYYENAVSSR